MILYTKKKNKTLWITNQKALTKTAGNLAGVMEETQATKNKK